MRIEDYGRWVDEGTIFEFDPPIEFGPGRIVRRIDVSHFFTADPDLRPEDVIEAMLNADIESDEPVETKEMVPVRCPDCDREGVIPVDEVPDGIGLMLLRCPSCRDGAKN